MFQISNAWRWFIVVFTSLLLTIGTNEADTTCDEAFKGPVMMQRLHSHPPSEIALATTQIRSNRHRAATLALATKQIRSNRYKAATLPPAKKTKKSEAAGALSKKTKKGEAVGQKGNFTARVIKACSTSGAREELLGRLAQGITNEFNDDSKGSAPIADTVSLNEQGFQRVAKLNSSAQMSIFILRTISKMKMEVNDDAPFIGFVPFYTDEESKYYILKHELHQIVKTKCSWLSKRGRPSIGKSAELTEDGYQSVAKEKNLYETKLFVERLLDKKHMCVKKEGAVDGLLPFYSCQKGTRTLKELRKELDGWTKKGWTKNCATLAKGNNHTKVSTKPTTMGKGASEGKKVSTNSNAHKSPRS